MKLILSMRLLDSQQELAHLVRDAVREGVSDTLWVQALILLILALCGGGAVLLQSYLKKKGEQLATKEDFESLLDQVRRTAEVTEEIKGNVSRSIAVLSANRQQWINTLRDQIAEFNAIAAILDVTKVVDVFDKESFAEKLQRALFLETKINLLLNPKEADHAQLASLLRQAVGEMLSSREKAKSGEMARLREKIISTSQPLLKREWIRVKDGE